MEEGSFAEELYPESLQLSKIELDAVPAANAKQNDSGNDEGSPDKEDESLWDGSDEEFDKPSGLDREWQKRRDQFFTIGYRDGLIAGKEDAAQEGFNVGFRQSVFPGYNWGHVRGVTSALAFLPDELKVKLVETKENRDRFQSLYASVHSISTTDALKLFSDDLIRKNATECSEHAVASSDAASLDTEKESRESSSLDNYVRSLQSLIVESAAIRSQFPGQ